MFREACEMYEDSNGVLKDRNKVIDGNAVLYTGAKFSLLKDFNELNLQDLFDYDEMVAAIEKQPGLLQRYKKPDDQEAHDNYIGAVVASVVLDDGVLASRIVRYGRKNWYSWDNLNPGKWSGKTFFARHPGFWATLKAGADEWLNPFDQLMAFIDLVMLVFSEDGSSGTLMDYLQYKVYTRKCSWIAEPLVRLGCVIFKAAYFRRHPKGIKESYAEYFGPEYPLAQIPDGMF